MKLKFLQWNIWYKENIDHIIKEIKRLDADVITAQEFIIDSRNNTDVAQYVAKELGFNYFYQTADTWDNQADKEAQGNAIFSRFPIIKTNFVHINQPRHNPENALEEGRAYVEATIDIKGKPLTVGTTHLSFTPNFKITDPRKKEADNLINAIKENKANYIFGADLNADPDSYIIKEFEKYFKNAGPDHSQKTFANQPFNYHGIFEVSKLKWRLDYIFTSPDIKVSKAQVIETKYSDHLPILAEIKL